jgi:tetratricopeptide (TPR) repeat protein
MRQAMHASLNQIHHPCRHTWLSLPSLVTAILLALSISIPIAAQAPTSPAASLGPAQSLLQQGHLDEAKAGVLAELEQHPSSIEALNLLGIIETRRQDFPAAVAAFQKALALSPASTPTHINLGNCYIAQNKLDLAEKEFRAVLRTDPANRDGNYNLALLLLSKGTPAQASQAILYLERIHPQDRETKLNLVAANFRAQRSQQALHLAAAISAESTSDVQVHFTLANLLASERQYKLAQHELELADSLAPGTFEILLALAEVSLHLGSDAQAELELDRALKLNPNSPQALYLLAQLYNRQSRPLDALDLLVRAGKLAPENVDILLLTAQVSIAQRYYEDAIPLLVHGIELAPQRADLHATLGESYFKSDKVDKAIEQLQQAIALAPSVRAYALLGLSYTYLGRFAEARQSFQSGLKLAPRDPFCLFHLGYLAARQGEPATAAATFQKVLAIDPSYPYALIELANLRIESKQYPEAETLLKKYVQVSDSPAAGYYKLAMVERSLHQTEAANRDLSLFQSLSRNATPGAHLYEHLYDYLDTRSKLAPQAREQQDLASIQEQIAKHPGQPQLLYSLIEANLKAARIEDARKAVSDLTQAAGADYRTLAGAGVLLARYRLYDDAIPLFQKALEAKPDSDELHFDLADAYFHRGLYSQALDAAQLVSADGQKDDAYLTLLGDIQAHQGDPSRAAHIFEQAIERNPDNDQNYLSLALLRLRQNDIPAARQTLLKGQARLPASGKLLWGLGLAAALDGDTPSAIEQLDRAVNLLPEWPGSYSTLGVVYFQTGQIEKAREVLDRFKNSNTGGLDINRIEQALASAPASSASQTLSAPARRQLLQMALFLADKTL